MNKQQQIKAIKAYLIKEYGNSHFSKSDFKNISIMVDLTKYTSKAVLQLLKSSNSFNAILPNYTNKMVGNWLSSRYKLTSEQLTYILTNI